MADGEVVEVVEVPPVPPTKAELMEMVRTGKYDVKVLKSVSEIWSGTKMRYTFTLVDGTKISA